MTDYRDRLRQNVQLTSPDGNVFNPLWRGDTRTQEKKIGIFNFPNVNGSVVQDLGASSMKYTLTLFFEGANNDIDSNEFMAAIQQKGVWKVIHPVHGLKELQPLSFSPIDDPVSSGNVTQIDTEWIEPIKESTVVSTPELQSSVASQIDTVNDTTADQLNNSTFQDTAAETGEFRDVVGDVVANVEEYLEGISSASAEITAEMEAIKRDLDNVLDVLPLDMIAVAGQIQELIQLPTRAIEDTQARLDTYQNFAEGISLLSPETAGTPSYNRVAVQELAFTAIFSAVADVSSTGKLQSRSEAVQVVEAVLTLFNDATDTLDTTQELFEGQPIDRQYFSQTQSYSDSSKLIALTVAYLLRSLFDLKIEKRFVLDRDRNPVMVTIEEYGSLGDEDINLDLFLESNKIEDTEHLIMLKGRELVVYV
jgi:prophage DNA circulation protein